MIVVNLIGGLGNQMFQYAAGKALALRHKVPLKVDLSFLNADTQGKYTKRKFELSIFETDIKVADPKDTWIFGNSLSAKFKKMISFFSPVKFAKENGPGFNQQFLDLPATTYLEGFWQTEKYFKNVAADILKEFTFKKEIIQQAQDWAAPIKERQSVSLHVRRGDYVSLKDAFNFHGLCSPLYYKAAVAKIAEREKNIELFIFSDDLDWCRQNLKFNFPTHFVKQGSAAVEMYLMSLCKHNIIANSSFSWWGAWLNQNPKKIVVAPKKWFTKEDAFSPDIYPEGWLRM